MRKFVVYKSEPGNQREQHRFVEGADDYLPPEQRVRDISYHWALWVVAPPPTERFRKSGGWESVVPPQSAECPWGATADELAALRAGTYIEALGDGQFHPDPTHEHGSVDTIAAHILEQWDRMQQHVDDQYKAVAVHLGISG